MSGGHEQAGRAVRGGALVGLALIRMQRAGERFDHDVEATTTIQVTKFMRRILARMIGSVLIALAGCGPAINTESLPLSRETAKSPLDGTAHHPLSAPPIYLEPITDTPPFVYQLRETTPSDAPLFVVTIQSCGMVKHPRPSAGTRLLVSGLDNVRITKGNTIELNGVAHTVTEATARLQRQPVFLRIVSFAASDCLTDIIVFSTRNGDLTLRATPVLEHLLFNYQNSSPPPASLSDKPSPLTTHPSDPRSPQP